MKVYDIKVLLVYYILFQTTFVITISPTHKKPQINFEARELQNAVPPDFKVFLLMCSRYTESPIKLDLPVSNDLILSEKINLKNPIVFIIHGYLSSGYDEWQMQLAQAYFKRRDVNVFIVDWSTGAMTPSYLKAIERAHDTSKILVSFIELLIKKHYTTPSYIHLIGHSLGAQISGFVGKRIPKLYRITGLDPAAPEFPDTVPRLASTDATFVEVLHTSTSFGQTDPLGDVDFYFNAGDIQPGCEPPLPSSIFDLRAMYEEESCSHHRAIDYFTESIENTKCLFVGARTLDEATRLRGKDFDRKIHTIIGLYTFVYKPRGIFYIVTNDASRHCRSS